MPQGFDRRNVIRFAAATGAALLPVNAGLAKGDSLAELLGLKLTSKPLNILKTIAAIIEIEQTADIRGLPKSALAFKSDALRPNSDSSLYQAAVPRLVTLIDRCEVNDPGLSDQAGELLADVNASQHVVPDALRTDLPPEEPQIIASFQFGKIRQEYAALFASATIRPEFADTLSWYFEAIKRFRPRYEALGKQVGVPWFFIGAIHGLEASFNFRAHFHNGDFPLKSRTRQVPAGRPLVWGPPSDWEASAKDALKLLGFTGQSDWSVERTLYRLEAYNGFGYRKRRVATPYLWSFSSHYDRGKFVSDGRWNPEARSQQCGAATVIKALSDAGEISFT